jgi:two-component system NarL family sensor kinase
VTTAGRPAHATRVAISLRRLDNRVELGIRDDGRGFGDVDPLAPGEPGHMGLATIRERAELVDGELRIATGASGTDVVVTAPLSGGSGRAPGRDPG